jgi:hypothetical protein
LTAESTITGRVAEMHASMAAQPPNEVMGAFIREQAALAAAGLPDLLRYGADGSDPAGELPAGLARWWASLGGR